MLQECFCFLQTQNALYIQWRKGGHMGSKLWNRIMTIYCKYAGNIASWMFLGFRQTRNAIYIWNGGGGHMGSYLWNGMIAIYSSGLVESLHFRVGGVQPRFPHKYTICIDLVHQPKCGFFLSLFFLPFLSFHVLSLFSFISQSLICNLPFDVIGHFSLLKEVNLSFFLISILCIEGKLETQKKRIPSRKVTSSHKLTLSFSSWDSSNGHAWGKGPLGEQTRRSKCACRAL